MFNRCLQAAREYRQLEINVRKCLSGLCKDFCSGCGDCCKAEICFESVESDWLRIVRELERDKTLRYSSASGWLSPKGCILKAGRPPLCYEFFCEGITDYFQAKGLLPPILAISKLMSVIGQNALGKKHLVALEEGEILHKLNFNRLRQKITKANETYEYHNSLLEQC